MLALPPEERRRGAASPAVPCGKGSSSAAARYSANLPAVSASGIVLEMCWQVLPYSFRRCGLGGLVLCVLVTEAAHAA